VQEYCTGFDGTVLMLPCPVTIGVPDIGMVIVCWVVPVGPVAPVGPAAPDAPATPVFEFAAQCPDAKAVPKSHRMVVEVGAVALPKVQTVPDVSSHIVTTAAVCAFVTPVIVQV
jgi:hypothetical protein